MQEKGDMTLKEDLGELYVTKIGSVHVN